ncbi:putative lipid II flippase FtsW [Angelakisella massiliensis]|uniref:putative lipid II flippase FtsW n=1 Tax=Angelakisella massiliensis TaxID=1871018 RepID=UPI000A3FACEC|nr:putative lipid II flippase FtsW [Angelakisella massiliensis]
MSLLFGDKKRPQYAKGGVDLTFLLFVLVLLVFGLVMMFSASYAYAYYYDGNSFHYITRQLIFAIMGLGAMAFFASWDYHIWHRFAWLSLAVSVVLLILVFTQPSVNDAHRWIWIGSQSFQPSEIAKFSLVLVFAHMISINYDKMKTFRYGILPFGVILVLLAGLIMPEPHLSATVLVVLLGAVMIFVGGASLKWFGLAALGGGALAGVAMMIPAIRDRAMYRIEIWLDPFLDPQGAGFQTVQSLYAIGSGGLLGAGIGNSRQKYLFLPEPQNDFVFAVVCEELGFVGAVLVILFFALLVWRGLMIAVKARDRFGTMLATGLTAQVGLQAVLNVAVVTNSIPNTGISLPFFSYGGTSLMMLLAQMGIILSISRQTALEKE